MSALLLVVGPLLLSSEGRGGGCSSERVEMADLKASPTRETPTLGGGAMLEKLSTMKRRLCSSSDHVFNL
jgi:hypothetical protein